MLESLPALIGQVILKTMIPGKISPGEIA